jgi:hypothetical protein
VRVTLATPGDLRDLLALDLDVTENVRATYADVVATLDDEQALARRGFLFRVLDPDMHASYLEVTKGAAYPSYFHTYASTVSDMRALHAAYPAITSDLVSIGKTIEGRDIWAMEVANPPGAHDPLKPEALEVGCHHAREPMSVEIPLDILHTLTEQYGVSAEVTDIVNTHEVWIIPMLNADGHVYCETTDENWRKNRRNNGDGSFGVDLNRNYSFKWGIDNNGSSGNTRSDTYRGTAPFSEPETQAIRDFAAQHHFLTNLDFHSYGEEYIYPWGYANNIYTPDDLTFSVAADSLARQNGYDTLVGWQLYLTNGEADDWWYGETTQKPRGFSCTPEVGRSFYPSQSAVAGILADNREPALYWIRSAGLPSADATVQLSTHAITVSRGGTLSFSYNVTNNTANTVTWKQWNEIVLPNQQPLSSNPAGGYRTLTLAPAETRTTTINKTLSGTTPLGTYTWASKVAVNVPWPVLASDVLTFTVTTADAAAGARQDKSAIAPADVASLSDRSLVEKTPPSHETPTVVPTSAHNMTILFAVTGTPPATLPILDIAGHVVARIAVIADGAGRARATWDGRTQHGPAPKGIYVARTPAGPARFVCVR